MFGFPCYEVVVRVLVEVGGGNAGKGPSVHSMRLCSWSCDARKWSWSSVWLKFLCIVSPSCSLLGSLAIRYRSKILKNRLIQSTMDYHRVVEGIQSSTKRLKNVKSKSYQGLAGFWSSLVTNFMLWVGVLYCSILDCKINWPTSKVRLSLSHYKVLRI